MVLLSDERIAQITCIENNEQIISLKQIHKKIHVDETRSQIANQSDLFCYARQSVAERLIEATHYLPNGYQFSIKEAYRPLSMQKRFFEEYFQFFQTQHSQYSDDEVYSFTSQYVAPVHVAGHPTGGAIDITLLKDNSEIDMGSGYNDIPNAPKNLTYLHSTYISDQAKDHRGILIACLEKVGFVNYPTEWWHWSYGDRYWAFHHQCDAFYDATDESAIL